VVRPRDFLARILGVDTWLFLHNTQFYFSLSSFCVACLIRESSSRSLRLCSLFVLQVFLIFVHLRERVGHVIIIKLPVLLCNTFLECFIITLILFIFLLEDMFDLFFHGVRVPYKGLYVQHCLENSILLGQPQAQEMIRIQSGTCQSLHSIDPNIKYYCNGRWTFNFKMPSISCVSWQSWESKAEETFLSYWETNTCIPFVLEC
jgi:hypothetical protein